MRDSIVSEDWIKAVYRQNPSCTLAKGGSKGKDGTSNQLIRLPPGRIAFPMVGKDSSGYKQYSVSVLFDRRANLDLLHERILSFYERWPEYYNRNTKQWDGLIYPIRDQKDRENYPGFTPGNLYVNAASIYPPSVRNIDGKWVNRDISRKQTVYPGVWAVVVVKPASFSYDNNPTPARGVTLYLSGIAVVGDDEQLVMSGASTLLSDIVLPEEK